MSLFYITGPPGVGKSTVQQELIAKGYEAYGIDQPRFGGPVNLKTGERTIVPPIEERSKEWFEQHEWRVSRLAIEELKSQARDKDIFLCGVTTTEHLVWDLFDKILYLNVNEATLRHRLANRTDNDYGQTASELQEILERYRKSQENLKGLDVAIVDAEKSLDEVVGEIIQKSKN